MYKARDRIRVETQIADREQVQFKANLKGDEIAANEIEEESWGSFLLVDKREHTASLLTFDYYY